MNLKWIHKLVFALSLSTIGVVGLYSLFGDTRKLQITPNKFDFHVTSDVSEGGLSRADIDWQGDRLELSCELKQSDYAWPYCGLSVYTDVVKANQGIDLSNYHTVRVKLRYLQAGDGERKLRLYLRNFNPAYSVPGEEYTIKYNGVQFDSAEQTETLEIPIKNLQVMTWWLADNDVPIEYSAPEYANVTRIDLSTGAGAGYGSHKIIIDKIEFEGTYLPRETLLFVLLFSWMALGLAFSLNELRKRKNAIDEAQKRHRHLKKLYHSLRAQNFEFAELAHRDALTGAMNRHAVREWLERQARQVRWGHNSLSILYLDLDHFKAVNDQFGHQMGDDILREFVMVIASALEAEDRLVRWGGEEFVLFCPDVTLQFAAEKAERIRKHVENHLWLHGNTLTCSIGIAELQNERVTEALARADEALYQAKDLGRNRVEVNYGLMTVGTAEAS